MGYWKEQQIIEDENRARGYRVPDHNETYLCLSHFDNQHLINLLTPLSRNGRCSYCGKKTNVIDLADFMEAVCARLIEYIGPMDNEGLYLASSFMDDDDEYVPGWAKRGPYIAPDNVEYYESEIDVMYDFDLYTDNDALNKDIENCLYVDGWIRRDPTGLLMKDKMIFSWKAFASLVKVKLRYTFFRSEEYYEDIDGNYYLGNDIIADISSMVGVVRRMLPVGTKLYRGRPKDEKAPYTEFKELTSPPSKLAKNNRMNPQGISLFYGSLDKETPISEIRNYLDDKSNDIFLGEFEITKELNIIDLCSIPSPDFWMGENGDWQNYSFLRSFHNEISKPVNPNDEATEYIPTQVFSEYLRYIQKTDDGKKYDGIIYKSSLTRKKNIVLFYDNKTSEDILRLSNIEIVKYHIE